MKKFRIESHAKFVIVAIILFLALVSYTTFSNEQTLTVKVNGLEKVERISGNKDFIDTRIYYLLYTNKGTFQVNISGIMAHPELIGTLEKDSVYEITTCGVNMSLFGYFPIVINVKK